jgi:hypothetical protein
MKFYVIKGIVVSHQITPAETGCLLIDFVVILFLFLFLFFLGSCRQGKMGPFPPTTWGWCIWDIVNGCKWFVQTCYTYISLG